VPAHWRTARRRRYSPRSHDVATRAPAGYVWYRGPAGDHAFSTGTTGFLRSACKDARWDVRMTLVEGTVDACASCLAVVAPPDAPTTDVAPETESELRLAWGDR